MRRGEVRGRLAPAALLVGVEIGGQSSLVTWSSRDQELPRAEVLLVASVWVPAPYYSAGVRRKKETSPGPRGRYEPGRCLEAGGDRRGPRAPRIQVRADPGCVPFPPNF